MKAREVRDLGIPAGEPVQVALKAIGLARGAGFDMATIRDRIRHLAADPETLRDSATFGELAAAVLSKMEARRSYVPRVDSAECG